MRLDDLPSSGYTGTAYVVYCEVSDGIETFGGMSGEYADDSPDVFFDEAEAVGFAEQAYGRAALASVISRSPGLRGDGACATGRVDAYDVVDGALGEYDEVWSTTVRGDEMGG